MGRATVYTHGRVNGWSVELWGNGGVIKELCIIPGADDDFAKLGGSGGCPFKLGIDAQSAPVAGHRQEFSAKRPGPMDPDADADRGCRDASNIAGVRWEGGG